MRPLLAIWPRTLSHNVRLGWIADIVTSAHTWPWVENASAFDIQVRADVSGRAMIAELKDISSVDWDGDTELPMGSCVWFHLEIGEAGHPGADLFQIGVCDPAWRDLNVCDRSQEFSFGDVHFAGEAILLLDTIDMLRIKQAVNSILNRLGAFEDWLAFGHAMKKFADWEFDGYRDEAS